MNTTDSPIIGEFVLGLRIPSLIINKLKHFNVQTGHDILRIDVDEFAAQCFTGVKSVEAFVNFKRLLEEQTNLYESLDGNSEEGVQAEKGGAHHMESHASGRETLINLPTTGLVGESSDEMWRGYSDAVHEFLMQLDLRSDYSGEELIGQTFGLFGFRQMDTETLSRYIGKSQARVNQLIKSLISKIRFFNGGGMPFRDQRYCLDSRIVQFLGERRRLLEEELVMPIDESDNDSDGLRNLWAEVNRLKIGPPSKFNFTDGRFVFLNYQRHGDAFAKLGKAAVDYLNEKVINVGETELTEKLRVQCSHIPVDVLNELIPHVLNKFPEIEQLPSRDCEERRYQLKFWKLSRGDRRAYRVLFERNEPMTTEDLVDEVKERMRIYDSNFDCTKESLRLVGSDNQFRSRGKLGVWGLLEWSYWDETQTGGIDDVIRLVLEKEGKSMELGEIVKRCLSIRPDLKADSVQTRCYVVCERLTDDNFILHKWANTDSFKDLVIADREKYGDALKNRSARVLGYLEDTIAYLENQPDKMAYSISIFNHLRQKHPSINSAILHKLFRESPMLKKTVVKGRSRLLIELIDEERQIRKPFEEEHQGQLTLW